MEINLNQNFSFPPLIKMAATWRLFFFNFFSESPRNRVYIYVFGVCESISIVRFHVRLKTRLRRPFLVLSILINCSYFQLIALKPGIYRVTASAEGYLSACTVFLGGQLLLFEV